MAIYLNNEFVEHKNAQLHVADLSMQRGYGVFDFLRTMNGIPFFLNDHLERFYFSAEKMFLPVEKSKEEMALIVKTLIRKSENKETGIRIMLTGGYSPDAYNIAQPNLVITCNPVKTTTDEDFEKGYSMITYDYQRDLPHVKSINYLMAVWLQHLVKEKNVSDVLYCHKEIITELPRSNIFMVSEDGKLITPKNNILAGITRKNVLSFASSIMHIEERDISVYEIMHAAEVFITSTTKKILPVFKINDAIIGDGKPGYYTRKLYQRFLQLEKSFLSTYETA